MPDQIWVFYSAKVAQCKADFFFQHPSEGTQIVNKPIPLFYAPFFLSCFRLRGYSIFRSNPFPLFFTFFFHLSILAMLSLWFCTHKSVYNQKSINSVFKYMHECPSCSKGTIWERDSPQKGATHILRAMLLFFQWVPLPLLYYRNMNDASVIVNCWEQ